ncbi:MAG: hypothetical protein IT176_13475 [Acidobacteria bacterium]|nr:hypothetical protein [Acidobacteriota bacterium]
MTPAAVRLARAAGRVAILTAALVPALQAQQSDLAQARDLYASAAYEDALNLLNRLKASNAPLGYDPAVDQYRAFCLIALDRPEDAQHAIESVVAAEPMYHPSPAEFSPRVRSVFTEVRRRMLPAIIQERYLEAKASYDNALWEQAADQFRDVLAALGDPDLGSAAAQPPLADLAVLAAGFADLSTTRSAPPPPPPPVAAAEPAPIDATPIVYSGADANVVPPLTLNQQMPEYPEKVEIPRTGKVELVIDESGGVEAAAMIVPLGNRYDALLLAASRDWRYKPASLNGVPVKYRKIVRVALRP